MATYGEVPRGAELIAQFYAHKLGGYHFDLHPELWAVPAIGAFYDAKVWIATRFTDPPSIDIPAEPGIYMFVVAPHCGSLKDHSYIFYVGQTLDLRRRYKNYLDEQKGLVTSPREKVVMFLNHLQGYVYFHYLVVPENELDVAENLLKDNLTPPANDRTKVIGRLETGVPA